MTEPLVFELSHPGRCAVALPEPDVPPTDLPSDLLRDDLFPVRLRSRTATGNWVPVNHVVRAHPIFDGLPSNGFMGQAYANVCAVETLVGVQGEAVAGSLSYEWRNKPRNYLGLDEFWWGADLAVVPHGQGRLILSTLRLLPNLGTDPVADRILFNMIRYGASLTDE